jgi:hypothetical protein
MSSESVRTTPPSPRRLRLRHPAETPFFVVMVV